MLHAIKNSILEGKIFNSKDRRRVVIVKELIEHTDMKEKDVVRIPKSANIHIYNDKMDEVTVEVSTGRGIDPHQMLIMAILTVLVCLLFVLYFSFNSCKCAQKVSSL